jgi:hypothetical protein
MQILSIQNTLHRNELDLANIVDQLGTKRHEACFILGFGA